MSVAPASDGSLLAAYRSARTPAELNRCRIAVTGAAAPQEVVELLDEVDRLPVPERRWVRDLAAQLTAEVPAVREFERSDVHPGVRFYRDRSPDPSAPRTLLVAFAGKAHRLMVHTPVFLQHLPAQPYDVLFLIDPVRDAFRSGIPGVASDLPGLADWIRSDAGSGAARLQTIGVSMGGGPALLAALLLGAERGVCVGGGLDQEEADPTVRAAIDGRGAGRGPAGSPGLLAVYSADNRRDAGVAAEIAEWLPDLVRVEVRPASDHAALHEAQVHGALAALLQLLLVEPVVATTASSEPTGSVVTFQLPDRRRSEHGWRGRARQWRRRVGPVARRGAELGLGRLLYALPVDRATKQRLSSIAYLRAGLLIIPRARRRLRVR